MHANLSWPGQGWLGQPWPASNFGRPPTLATRQPPETFARRPTLARPADRPTSNQPWAAGLLLASKPRPTFAPQTGQHWRPAARPISVGYGWTRTGSSLRNSDPSALKQHSILTTHQEEQDTRRKQSGIPSRIKYEGQHEPIVWKHISTVTNEVMAA